VHGPLDGNQLDAFPVLHMTVGQALAAYPEAQVALSDPSLKKSAITLAQEGVLKLLGNRLPPGFARTMGVEDRRRPRMESGLAVWTDHAQRFYPLEALWRRGNALIDELDGSRLLVYIDPITDKPTCLRTDSAGWSWHDDTLLLQSGDWVRGGVLYGALGAIRAAERPRQSITCWYGYAFAFPGGEVYEC
jgi:hypothetical protein